jgi:FKBP-type peptidyl-prolyl cis-trans isomerase
MKLTVKFFVSVFTLGLCATLAAGENTSSSGPIPARPDSTAGQSSAPHFSNQQVIETWGWIIAHEKSVDQIEISESELSAFLKGVDAGFKGKPAPYNYGKIIPDVEKLAKARREKVVQAITEKNQTEAKKYYAELDKDTNVVKLPDGLRYEIVRPGTGPCPKPQQTVTVHFLGHLLDGTEFTQMGPFDLVLWTNRFESYLYEGIQKLNKGGLMQIYPSTPPSEREQAMYGIPPGSAMVFVVELLDIKPTPDDVLADTLLPAAPGPEALPPSGFSEPQIIETWGWSIARKTPVSILDFSEAELALLTKGLVAGIKGEPPPCEVEKIQPDVERFISDRREQAWQAYKKRRNAETEAFFAELKKNTNVVTLPSGLGYEILKPGSGPYPKAGKTVKIHYVGRLLNGKVFDRIEGEDTCKVEINNPCRPWVIAGWNEGLQKINQGGKIKLYIPPSLGYGDQGSDGAPPCSTLIFEIEMLDIADTPPPDNATPAS